MTNTAKNNLLIFILALGVFGIINTEMGIIGIIPLIAETFHVSVPSAGWTVSVFALVVAVSGPVMPILFSGINRKVAMLLALGVFIISNIISIYTDNFTVILLARAIPAFFHPVYVSMAFTVAAASSSKEDAPKAVSRIFIGVSAGMVLGVPLTSFIAAEKSFAAAMTFFAIINMLVFAATMIYVPSLPVTKKLSPKEHLKVLRKPTVRRSIAAVIWLNGAVFGFFSYMSDYLKNITEISFTVISIILFIYGAANIIGNIAAGKMLADNVERTLKSVPFALGAAYIMLFVFGSFSIMVAVVILILGILAGISANNGQYMISTSAPEAPDFANGLFLTAANLGTAAGTYVCGLIISGVGLKYVMDGALFFLIPGIIYTFMRQETKIKQTENMANGAT